MSMKTKLMAIVFAMSAACAFALAPVVANADCNCKKSKCHKSSKSSTKKQAMQDTTTTTNGQSTGTSAPGAAQTTE